MPECSSLFQVLFLFFYRFLNYRFLSLENEIRQFVHKFAKLKEDIQVVIFILGLFVINFGI